MKKKLVDILIIGGGQAGLCVGFFLKKLTSNFLIIEKSKKIGNSWRNRYDCLMLLTPRGKDSLPGFPISGERDGYPLKNEFADYLEKYANHFSLPVEVSTNITKLSIENGKFRAISKKDMFEAKKAIIATGAFQKPYIPTFANLIPKNIFQIHTSDYKNNRTLPKGKVLVIGAGNSGAQISVELSSTHDVTLATRKKLFSTKKLDFAYTALSKFLKPQIMRKIVSFLRLRKIQEQGLDEGLKSKKLKLRSEVIDFKNNSFIFKKGEKEQFDIVVWATGFKFDYSWIKIPQAFDKNGRLLHKSGVSIIPGLYFIYPSRDDGFIYDLPKKAEHLVNALQRG